MSRKSLAESSPGAVTIAAFNRAAELRDKPITLSISAYKQLRVMTNTINSITDVVADGVDIKQELVVGLLVQLIEQANNTIEQIERDQSR